MAQLATHPIAEYDALLEEIFPLPVNAVEAFMIADGRPNYPMMCDIEVRLQGSIQRQPFEEALNFAVARAPLFRSVLSEDKKRGLVWQLTDRLPSVDWGEYGEPCLAGYDDLIDLHTDPGIRIYVRSGEERSTILIHFHHATCDGLGAFVFVEDLLSGYHNATPGVAPVKPRAWEPERLRKRCTHQLENPGLTRGLYDLYCGIRGATNFFMERPLPMTAGKPLPAKGSAKLQNGLITLAVPPDATRSLRSWTSARKVTLNDVLLRDLFVALHTWMSNQGHEIGSRRLRILMPQSLRGRGDGAMPSTNDLGFAFLARRGPIIESPQNLLESLTPELAAIRKDNLSRHFIGGLEMVQKLGLLPWLLNGSSCFSTAVLTNFGNAWRRFQTKLPKAQGGLVAGNLIYDGLVGTPPCRPHTGAAFSVTTTAQQIFLSVKQDPYHYSREESTELLRTYVEQVTRSANS
ncbi:hypothetical protein [Blastopirellula marina]|uniref:Condensation domain-containing protein n=1 Tax=Blastopirellula marina TaxID=124 RepID=A0A2S8GD10_9BACT|nr:hypothetical protein [Blastopirellula marina]PQO42348.1 hypothetical protein C5Y93_28865 [Blastopirellula marina]